MLFGDRAKYIGIVVGLTFASLLITQQSAIFAGMMTRTFSFLTDVGLPDIWVVDPQVKYIDDIKPIQDTDVLRVRGVEGVKWAVPLYKGTLAVRLSDGTYQSCIIIGLDDETLMGGPPQMLTGKLADLRRSGGVIVDVIGAGEKLAHVLPNGKRVPLKVGDQMEINDNQSVVVGICKVTQTFQANPVIYTTYSSATLFAPGQRLLLSFVTVKAKPGPGPKRFMSAHRTGHRPKSLHSGRVQNDNLSLLPEIHWDADQFLDCGGPRFFGRSRHFGPDVL